MISLELLLAFNLFDGPYEVLVDGKPQIISKEEALSLSVEHQVKLDRRTMIRRWRDRIGWSRGKERRK